MDETATLQYQSQLAAGPFRSCFTLLAIDHKPPCSALPSLGVFSCPDIPFVSTRATWVRVTNGTKRRSVPAVGDDVRAAVNSFRSKWCNPANCEIKIMSGRVDGTSTRLARTSVVSDSRLTAGVVRSEFPNALATPIQPSRDARCEDAAAPKQQAAASSNGRAAGRQSRMDTNVRFFSSLRDGCAAAQ